MRSISKGGNFVTLVADEPELASVAQRVVEMMAGHGYKTDKYSMGQVTVLTTVLECKRWEKAERRLIQEEAIRLLNESVWTCVLR